MEDASAEKLELVYRILKDSKIFDQKNEQQFICFNTKAKKVFNYKEIVQLSEADNKEFASFSDIVHQMPTSDKFEMKDDLLWDKYQNLFIKAIPKSQPFHKIIDLPDDPAFESKEKKYKTYQKKADDLEQKFINAANNGANKEALDIIKDDLKENLIKWKKEGSKGEIDHIYSQYLAKEDFSNTTLWNSWKNKAAEADFFIGIDTKNIFGSYELNFSGLKNGGWQSIPSVRRKALKELLHHKASINDSIAINDLIKDINEVTFKYCLVNIRRNWFDTDVFESNGWKWHPNYNGKSLSNGKLLGEIPSYITDLIFIKDIRFRKRFNNSLFYFLDWVSSLVFKSSMQTFIHNNKDEQFLAGFVCEKVPPCPK